MNSHEWADIEQPSPLYIIPPHVRVGRGELTCLECGETFHSRLKSCPRCASNKLGWLYEPDESDALNETVKTRTVETISYLREDEYLIVA